MRRKERKQVEEIWAELENVLSVMDSRFNLKDYNLGQLDRERLDGLKDLITILRVQAKSLKHDVESTCREKDVLMRIIVEEGCDGP